VRHGFCPPLLALLKEPRKPGILLYFWVCSEMTLDIRNKLGNSDSFGHLEAKCTGKSKEVVLALV